MMLKPLIINLIVAHTLMFGLWLMYKHQKIPLIADVFWSIGIATQALIYCLYTRTYPLLLLLLFIWAWRLSSFLYHTRFKKQHLDPRYESLAAQSAQDPGRFFLLNFQIQAFLQFLFASVWFFLCQTAIPLPLTLISAAVIITRLCLEIHADKCLANFKQHGTGVCQLGLWRYSRHPNYFGELLIWFGFSIASRHYLGLVSPLVLLLIMRFITGPLSERLSLEHKGQRYAAYQQATPMIFPYKIFSAKF